MSNVNGKSDMIPTESETTRTIGSFSHGSRETPVTSTSSIEADRSEKARGHNPDMHVIGESDGSILPEKLANKTGTPVAELVEGREPPKGKVVSYTFVPVSVPSKANQSECTTTASKDGDISTVAAQGKSRIGSSVRNCAGSGQQWPLLPR